MGWTHHVGSVRALLWSPIQRLQGDCEKANHLLSSIFNIVAYTVILHWATVVAGEDAGPDSFFRSVQTLVMIFYVDDRFLASPRLARIQEALGILTGLFYRVVLRTNVDKRFIITC